MRLGVGPYIISLDGVFTPDAITPDLAMRLRCLADDLDRIAVGRAPTPADLEHAPLLVDWKLTLTLSGLSLIGFVAGHPLLGTKTIVTSPLWVLDRDLHWARTLSRFYRLGVRAGAAIPDGDQSAIIEAPPTSPGAAE
jgi:hypothetical protein